MKKLPNWRNATTIQKLGMVYAILDTIDEPHIFCCKIKDTEVSCHGSENLTSQDYCEMLAGHMISTAQLSGTTPYKILSAVGETMGDLVERAEKNKRRVKNSTPKGGSL